MDERRCYRCHDVILPGEDFFSNDGADSEEVYCIPLDFEWRGVQKEGCP